MPSSSIRSGGRELRVEQDVIDVSYLSAANEHWRFTDTHGHEHAWQPGPDPYPTLRDVYQDPWYCGECREVHEDLVDHLECRQCGETVRPGIKGPGVERVPGLRSYYLDGQPVTKEEAEAFIAAAGRG